MIIAIIGFVLLVVVLILRFLHVRQKDIATGLFHEALKNENSGNFEAALVNYETALIEVDKTKYNKNLRNKILEKIKVLHTVIDYEKGLFNLNKTTY